MKKKFIDKIGWQKASIQLYNSLYKRVKDDCARNGREFDVAFFSYFDSFNDGLQLKKKSRRQRNMPIACNDLD